VGRPPVGPAARSGGDLGGAPGQLPVSPHPQGRQGRPLRRRQADHEYPVGSFFKAGKSADLVVLSANIATCPPEQIGQGKVLLTVFRGKAVYTDPDF
jgi:hypothetical protein